MFLLLVLLLVISLQIDVGAIAVFKIRSLVYCIALMCGEKRDMCFDREPNHAQQKESPDVLRVVV